MARTGLSSAASVSACLVMVVAASGASAATITVNDTTDDYFAPPGGTCSLREAVQAANDNADFGGCTRVGTGGADTIVLEGGQTYSRSRSGIDDTNENGDFDITGKTTFQVEGPGRAKIDANDMDRAIEIEAGARLTASKLTITGGYVPGSQDTGTGGGAIRNAGKLDLRSSNLFDNEAQRGGDGCGCGGGIENRGRMILRRVQLVHNLTTYDGGGVFTGGTKQTISRSSIEGNTSFAGGGIYAYNSAIKVTASTISSNDATGSTFGDDGGGIYVGTSDGEPFVLVNSTVSGNRAADGGGGIFRFSGPLRFNAVTVTGNKSDYLADGSGHGGGIDGGLSGISFPDFKIRNSIFAGNQDLNPSDPAPDCYRIGTGFHADDLLTPDGGCPAGPDDVVAPDPRLKPLGDYGGPTRTHALRHGSPAVGEAGPKTAPARDQRGRKRDAHPDIGAYER